MKILHVSCSLRGQASESYRLSQKIIGFLLKSEPEAVLINRVIGGGAVSHIDGIFSVEGTSSGADAVAEIRIKTDLALREHFERLPAIKMCD